MKIIAILGLCGFGLLGGCATGPFEWKYGQDKIVPGQFTMKATETNGTVLTWPSHAVAAVVYPNGDAVCIQSAQSAKARNASGAGKLSAGLPAGNKIDLAVAQVINEAVASLQDRNDVATFLDVALFQICTMSRNKKMDDATTVALINKALETSEAIARLRPQKAFVMTPLVASGTVAVVPDPAKTAAAEPAKP